MSGNPELELDAAQALFAARMLEASIHHPGPWTMRWGTVEVPAIREFTEAGVVFTSTFPSVCFLEPPEGGVTIFCDGVVMGVRRINHSGDTQFMVTWEVAVRYQEKIESE